MSKSKSGSKTEKKRVLRRKTLRSKKSVRHSKLSFIGTGGADNKSLIVRLFLEMLNNIKLYHWKTHSFAQHKATDDLHSKLSENVDTFVEVLLGKDESRVKLLDTNITLLDTDNLGDFKTRIYEYRTFLQDMTYKLDTKKDTDLLNIRDEMLGHLNQFLYLLTFDK